MSYYTLGWISSNSRILLNKEKFHLKKMVGFKRSWLTEIKKEPNQTFNQVINYNNTNTRVMCNKYDKNEIILFENNSTIKNYTLSRGS